MVVVTPNKSLPYITVCLVDDCTIKVIDTGEELDVTYTTDSIIVTTPTDGYTSELIAKQSNVLPCVELDNKFDDHRLLYSVYHYYVLQDHQQHCICKLL